jgi:aspartate 1-decarboxylase
MFVAVTMLKSKIHRATITDANVDYEGSITIDNDLLENALIMQYEKVEIYNITNGERFSTYAIKGEFGSGDICVNGAAARKVNIGDKIIICSYMDVPVQNVPDDYKPIVIKVDENNKEIEGEK